MQLSAGATIVSELCFASSRVVIRPPSRATSRSSVTPLRPTLPHLIISNVRCATPLIPAGSLDHPALVAISSATSGTEWRSLTSTVNPFRNEYRTTPPAASCRASLPPSGIPSTIGPPTGLRGSGRVVGGTTTGCRPRPLCPATGIRIHTITQKRETALLINQSIDVVPLAKIDFTKTTSRFSLYPIICPFSPHDQMSVSLNPRTPVSLQGNRIMKILDKQEIPETINDSKSRIDADCSCAPLVRFARRTCCSAGIMRLPCVGLTIM